MIKEKWSDEQKLAVLFATDEKGYEANIGVLCPVCKTHSLYYDRTSVFDMTAWCSHCECGIRQGNGSSNDNRGCYG